MIVVIAIIGILAAILVPFMAGYLSPARDSRKEVNAKTIYTAAQAAVTSLEITGSLKDGTYDVVPGIPGTGTTQDANLNEKIEKLLGETNFDNLTKLQVAVANGAVTSVVVNDGSGDTTYTP